MKRVLITYGSVGGNTEMVCKKVAEVLKDKNIEAVLMKAEIGDPKKLLEFEYLVFGSPTYGHGQLEAFFERFLGQAKEEKIEGKKYAVIGLGDPKYDLDYLIESAKIIQNFCNERGAVEMTLPLKIVKSPVPHLETMVKSWAENLANLINQ